MGSTIENFNIEIDYRNNGHKNHLFNKNMKLLKN